MIVDEVQYFQDIKNKDNTSYVQDKINLEIYNQITDSSGTGFVTNTTLNNKVQILQKADQLEKERREEADKKLTEDIKLKADKTYVDSHFIKTINKQAPDGNGNVNTPQADWNATEGNEQILNKPDLSLKVNKAGDEMSGPLTIAAGDGKGILFKDRTSNININEENQTKTLLGFLNNSFTIGHPSINTMIRGAQTYLTGNNLDVGNTGNSGLIAKGVSCNTDYTTIHTQTGRALFIQEGESGVVNIGGTPSTTASQDMSAKLIVNGDIKEGDKKLSEKYQPVGNYLTEHQDISGKADKNYVDTELNKKQNIGNYAVIDKENTFNHTQNIIGDINVSNYLIGKRIQTTDTEHLNSTPNYYGVIQENGWLHKRTLDETKEDLSINTKADSDTVIAELNKKLNKAGDTISGDLIIQGDLTVQGKTTSLDVETVSTKDNIIELATGRDQSTGITTPVGLEVRNYDGKNVNNALQIVIDNEGTAKVGNVLYNEDGTISPENNHLQALATRENLKDQTLVKWDADKIALVPDTTQYAISVNGNKADSKGNIIVPEQVNANWTATEGKGVILNKPNIPSKVSELENDKNYLTEHQDISGKADKIYVDTTFIKTVNQITPDQKGNVDIVIPDNQVNSDWNATEGKAEILNKPDLSLKANVTDVDEKLNKKLNLSGGTLTGPLNIDAELKLNDIENFNSKYIKRVLGTGDARPFYADIPESGRPNTYRLWKIKFPVNSNFWGKIKITLYGGYSSFNASGTIEKEIICNFNGNKIYSNIGSYVKLAGRCEQDFRISEAIWNVETNQWEIWIFSKQLHGNNQPTIIMEFWCNSNTYIQTAKNVILDSKCILTKITTYTNVQGTLNGNNLIKDLLDLPVFETPYGNQVATIQDIENIQAISTQDIVNLFK